MPNYPKLPKELEKSSPKYKAGFDAESLPIHFANDIDKAAYIISSKSGNKKSKRHDDFVEWATKATGWDVRQINVLGMEIKSHMKEYYNDALNEGNFFIEVPDFYTKMKSEIDAIAKEDEEFDDEEEKIPEGLEDLLKEIESKETEATLPKPKRTRAKAGELTKRQIDILQNILDDLIKIKHRLTEIKTNQDAKIAYEKRRDRLQAERLAFLERERQIEALPEAPTAAESKVKSEQKETLEKKTKKSSWFDPIVNNALTAAFFSTILGGGGGSTTQPPTTSQPQQNSQNPFSGLTKTAIRMTPIPGINMIPFAEGGIIGPSTMLPFANGTQIQPLDDATNVGISGGTTFSRGFSMDDLKSPLAEVMKLPLKVAGAALLSAISSLSKQFDVGDSSLQTDLSKMISDVSRAFGLNRPTFGGPSATADKTSPTADKDNEQGKLIVAINKVADGLVGSGQTGDKQDDSGNKGNNNSLASASGTPGAAGAPGASGASGTPGAAGTPGISSSSSSSGAITQSETLADQAKQVGNSSTPQPYIGGNANITAPASGNVASISSDYTKSSEPANLGSTQYNNTSVFSPGNVALNSSLNFASPNQSLANATYLDQVNQYKFDPTSKPIMNSMSVAMGLPPVEAVRDMISSKTQPSFINLPPIIQKQKLNTMDATPEKVNRFGKPIYGNSNVASSIRSQVLA